MKKLLFPLVLLLSLTGCQTKPELREDIREFIANFNIKDAMDAYKKGGYTSEVNETSDGKKLTTRIEMEFSILDSENPTYVEVTTSLIDDAETSKVEVEFVEKDDKFYLSTNGELKESSLEECAGLIQQFFYKKVELEGEYHTQGWYYGDLVKNVAPVMQQYVTIDQEHELYVLDYTVHGDNEYHQTYSVNKLGMLVENHVSAVSASLTRTTDVSVHN